jgi:hypothetical protein
MMSSVVWLRDGIALLGFDHFLQIARRFCFLALGLLEGSTDD